MWCLRCEYELSDVPDGRCPECGQWFTREVPASFQKTWLERGRQEFLIACVLVPLPALLPIVIVQANMELELIWALLSLCYSMIGLGVGMLVPSVRRDRRRRRIVLWLAALGLTAWVGSVLWLAW